MRHVADDGDDGAACRRRSIQRDARLRRRAAVRRARLGDDPRGIQTGRRRRRRNDGERLARRPWTEHVAVLRAHAPEIISGREQIARDHIIRATWAQEEHI